MTTISAVFFLGIVAFEGVQSQPLTLDDAVRKIEGSSEADLVTNWMGFANAVRSAEQVDSSKLSNILAKGLKGNNPVINEIALTILVDNPVCGKIIAKDLISDVVSLLPHKNAKVAALAKRNATVYYRDSVPEIAKMLDRAPDESYFLILINTLVEIGPDAKASIPIIQGLAKNPRYSKFSLSVPIATIDPSQDEAMDRIAKLLPERERAQQVLFAEILARSKKHASLAASILEADLKKSYDKTSWSRSLCGLWEAGVSAKKTEATVSEAFKFACDKDDELAAMLSAAVLVNIDFKNGVAKAYLIDHKERLMLMLDDRDRFNRYFACKVLSKLQAGEALPALRKVAQGSVPKKG